MSYLDIQNVTKAFGGLTAIKELTLEIDEGELRCLIGPNGAGKTTLFNLICGNIEPDEGKIIFSGRPLNGLSVTQRSLLGIGRKFQSAAIFGNLTVLENLEVAAWGRSSIKQLASAKTGQSSSQVEEILEIIELSGKRDLVAQLLSHGEKQWLEIGMVLASRPSLLLFDEPTAGMTPAETQKTSQLIKEISQGATMIVIEHDLKFVREIGTTITVLHNGAILAEGYLDDIAKDEAVLKAYLGTTEL